jgi:hypothetical protein
VPLKFFSESLEGHGSSQETNARLRGSLAVLVLHPFPPLEDFSFAELTLEGREMVPRRVGRHRAESFCITDPSTT